MSSEVETSGEKSTDEKAENVILEEIPDNLIRLGLFVAKAFYGREHYVVLDYIQKNTCIKEDDLRQIIKFDQRFLRTILVQLKVDKLIKERFVSEEAEGRARKMSYYFLNYRALLNVAKYKIDHMRQRLEVKDKDEVHKASYKCSGCQYHYDAMEMDKIFDPVTQELRCWRCQQVVEPDDTAGPTDETRSSLAKFNEQMAPLFSMIQNLDGIRLAPHLLEPPIKATENIPPEVSEKKVFRVGERAFSGQAMASRSMLYQNGITVSIEGGVEGGNTTKVEEKKAVPWLQNRINSPPHQTLSTESQNAFADLVDDPLSLSHVSSGEVFPQEQEPNEIESMLIEEFGESSNFLPDENQKEEEAKAVAVDDMDRRTESTDDDDMVSVGGKKYYIEEVTPELVTQMSSEEKQMYIKLTQQGFDF
ncbi:hypothetical protein AB6A40_011371 [Gnathostoma spinigerum]|uniref:HTH TFE/IIEalpha-type domain-containing protein n=1 Tax=Gnathostoma spinigerum TaxID=75299 RepID=A0ABD6F3Z6_9BILA